MSDEKGFSTITGAAVIAVLAAILLAVLYVGAAVLARHRAQSAADLGALAAASAQVSGRGDACAVAEDRVSVQDGSPSVADCVVDGQDVVVRVVVRVRLGGFGVRAATAAARAGPVTIGSDDR
ncbi:pilus assembly protein TadG-related protein [Gordonia sp. HY002]|uniref:Rv3654c family TadE-like protein n=1 Tax=Gordonia zhenghanii TaxID=2911516 RepID=UPI001EF12470|nr:Rv3654c family TadE-like protein [Gordonia zhenghanii]MCF8569143.1 pilus assembly protein TadG-related protein [Gordonia zhenghanii]MCF8604609.1 pilus assembly protein TadG-related protein [Gordonia zhenghanii]